jgi:hypothetical protein
MSADLAARLNTEVAAEAAPLFVINLCASTSPMALSHPNTPELKRYTFFVSRQREDGRERFRLHMGYFASQEQAESLLAAVRDVYPAAWAGPAPTTGVPRRARISVAPMVTVAPPVAVAAALPPVLAVPAAPIPMPPVQAPPPPTLESMSNVRDVLAQLGEEAPRRSASESVAQKIATPSPISAAAPDVPAPVLNAAQALRVLESAAPAPPTVQPPVSARTPAPAPTRARAPTKARMPAAASGQTEGVVPVVTPEDTQTLNDIRLDAQNNAPPCFAVQLVWAVAPIDVASLPHLAIFDAYSLYNVEGNRQGRKWYGLRLGFFSDPNSATQVAHYVRSDYPAVAVVPVATRERDHAKGGVAPPARAMEAAAPLRPETLLPIQKEALDGFELLPDDAPRTPKRDVDDIGAREPAAAAAVGASSMTAREKIAAAAAGKPLLKSAVPVGNAAVKSTGKRVVVRKRPQPAATHRTAAPGAPNPLESTLDILGASTLTLDESREIVNDSAIRKPIEKKPGSRFSKLMSRLSGN